MKHNSHPNHTESVHEVQYHSSSFFQETLSGKALLSIFDGYVVPTVQHIALDFKNGLTRSKWQSQKMESICPLALCPVRHFQQYLIALLAALPKDTYIRPFPVLLSPISDSVAKNS
ncbi:MAG: hypothetical protein GWP61_21385 [Chloroflexi bacterium]|jgi:hypothetical protein|nr:hypothetical protein [Chloroflexota bacterium]